MQTAPAAAAALELARHGFSVFPVVANGKPPLIENWQNLATNDASQIESWWAQFPNANMGIHTASLLVIDIDPRNGGAVETLKALGDLPDTCAAATAGGGVHIVYRLPPHTTVRGGANKLGPGLDIKSYGGYIVGAGSAIDGRPYRWIDGRSPAETPPAVAPTWLIERCKTPTRRTMTAGKRVIEEDETALNLAEQYLSSFAPKAAQGERDNTAFKVAARLYDFGVSKSTCAALLLEWNDINCEPPLELDAVERIADSASRNRGNAIGARHPLAPGFEPHIPPLARQGSGLASPVTPFDVSSLPRRDFIIHDFAARTKLSVLVGPGGVSKSTLCIQIAVASATGRGDICGFEIRKRSRVWLHNQEDEIDEMRRRLAAVMRAFDVTWDDLRDEHGPALFLDSGVDRPLLLAKRTLEQTIAPTRTVDEIVTTIRHNHIDLFIADPLQELHEANENDNIQMREVMSTLRRIAVDANCAALLAAHSRKPPQAGSDGFTGDMDALRGASSQTGVARVVATLFTASQKDAKTYRFGGPHTDFARLDVAKNNMARRLPEPMWFKREGADVAGDSIGILRPVPVKKKETSDANAFVELIAETIDAGLARGTWHSLTDIVDAMSEYDKENIPNATNWSREIKKAFAENSEITTSFGALCRISKRGNSGTLFSLKCDDEYGRIADEKSQLLD